MVYFKAAALNLLFDTSGPLSDFKYFLHLSNYCMACYPSNVFPHSKHGYDSDGIFHGAFFPGAYFVYLLGVQNKQETKETN